MYGRRAASGFVVGSRRTVLANSTPSADRRPAARPRSRVSHPERLHRKPSRWWMRFPTAPGLRTTAAAARLRARGSRLRRGGHSARSPDSPHRARAGHTPHRAWEWPGSVAVGCRADVRMAESISPSTCPLRQTGRHPRGVPLARVRADLLAVAAQGVEDRLSGRPRSPASAARSPFFLGESCPCRCLGTSGGVGPGHR